MVADSRSPQSNRDAHENRVTMAVLNQKLEHAIQILREERDETKAWRREIEERMALLGQRCERNSTELARLDERQKATTGILTIFTLIVSTVAGAIGAVVK